MSIEARIAAVQEAIEQLRDMIEEERENKEDGDLMTLGKDQPELSKLKVKQRRVLRGHYAQIQSVSWGPRSQSIVSVSQDGNLVVWDAISNQKTHLVKLPFKWMLTTAFSPCGRIVACGGLDNTCTLYDISSEEIDENLGIPTGRKVTSLDGHTGYVSTVKICKQGTEIFTASGDQSVARWSLSGGTAQRLEQYNGHDRDVSCLCLSPDGKQFITGSFDRAVKLWDIRQFKPVLTFEGHSSSVTDVDFFPEANSFASVSDDGTCRLFDVRSFREMMRYCHYEDEQGAEIDEGAVEAQVTEGSGKNQVILVEEAPGSNENESKNEDTEMGVTSVCFSKTGRLLFTGYDVNVCVWDTIKGTWVIGLPHDSRVSCLALSPSAQAIASGSWDNTIKIWA